MIRALIERALQAISIKARHVIDEHGIERRGGRSVLIVRQIGARHEKHLAAVEGRSQCLTKRASRLFVLPAHEERDDLCPGCHALDEGHLHFERVLACMRRWMFPENRRSRHDRGCRVFIEVRHAERRVEATPVNGDTIEADEM